MSRRAWMPLYVGDYRTDTMDLSVEEHGIYLLLLMVAWQRPGGVIPNNEKWIRGNLPPMHGHTYNRLVPSILARFFCLSEAGFTNERLVYEQQNADKRSAKQKQNADKRWATHNKNKGLADAMAMQSQSQSQSYKEERKKETRARGDALLCDFNHFWELWPNKVGKPAARKAFHSAMNRGCVLQDVLDGIERYVRGKPADRPWLNPSTFLNQERWNDQPATTGERNGKPQSRIIQAADDLVRKIAEFDQTAAEFNELRGNPCETVVRLLPDRRRQ